MRFTLYTLIFIFSLTLISCGGEAVKEKTSTTQAEIPPAAAAAKPGVKNQVALESVPRKVIMDLWNSCTYIDYIFHDLPFSMSQDETESIQANLNYIATEPQAYIPNNCKPMARQMFHVGGDIVLECDVYLSDNCQFYVFVENEKPKYANKMTPDALKFFGTMFSKVDQQKGK